MCGYVAYLFSREDARYDNEIAVMRLGQFGRTCIRSRAGKARTAAKRDKRDGKKLEHERGAIGGGVREKENGGVIKYPMADIKSGRKMHQVPCS